MSTYPGPIRKFTQTAKPSVQLPAAMQSALGQSSVQLHAGPGRLVSHIEKHILHRHARSAIVAAFPSAKACPEFQSDRQAFRWLRSRPDVATDPVVDCYRRIVTDSLEEAATLGHFLHRRETLVSLDSAGLLVLIDRGTVVTAFIPGVESDFTIPLEVDHRSRHDILRAEERRRERDGDEAYFYEVFRPAIQQIRRFPVEDRISGTDYGALKLVLPTVGGLNFMSWLAMRAQLGHRPIDFAPSEDY